MQNLYLCGQIYNEQQMVTGSEEEKVHWFERMLAGTGAGTNKGQDDLFLRYFISCNIPAKPKNTY